MIKKIFQVSGLFFGFCMLLSVTIREKPIFFYIYELISPSTRYVQNKTEDFLQMSFSSTQNYSRKIFENSVPKVKDSVRSKFASQKKATGEPEEKISIEEKNKLDQLIKNH